VLSELGATAPRARETRADDPPPADPVHARVLDAMGRGPVDLDRLVTRTGLGADTLAATLVHLQLEGRVSALQGGGWQRLR